MKKILFLLIVTLAPCQSLAWDGYDYEKGTEVGIEEGNLVRSGSSIEIYDYEEGEYRDVEVEDVRSAGYGRVEVDVYDYESGEYRTLEMYK